MVGSTTGYWNPMAQARLVAYYTNAPKEGEEKKKRKEIKWRIGEISEAERWAGEKRKDGLIFENLSLLLNRRPQ